MNSYILIFSISSINRGVIIVLFVARDLLSNVMLSNLLNSRLLLRIWNGIVYVLLDLFLFIIKYIVIVIFIVVPGRKIQCFRKGRL